MLAKPFTDRRRLIKRTEELLGRKKLVALIERHRNDRTEKGWLKAAVAAWLQRDRATLDR
jgi:hypothetical protein